MVKFFVEAASLALIFSLEGLFPLFKGRQARLKHGLKNLSIGVLNGLAVSFLFSSLIVWALAWSEARSFGLLRLLSLNAAMETALAFLLFDLWMYGWHRANHAVPFLWRFHRMHHSDIELDSTSALRFHLGEILLSSALRLAVLPLLGLKLIHLFIYEICLQPVILFHHSNAALPEKWDRVFRALIVTPNMHRVHHSIESSETNSNYSSVFSFWDRLVQTFRKREDARSLEYGLPYFREPEWQSVAGMLKTPFVNPVMAPK